MKKLTVLLIAALTLFAFASCSANNKNTDSGQEKSQSRSSTENLESLTSGANWLDGERLDGGASKESVSEWINGLGIDITA